MSEPRKKSASTKLAEIAVRQNLLLWQISKSFLDIDKKLDSLDVKVSR